MSVSLKEILESAGYDFNDLEDLHKMQGILEDAEDLLEEIESKIDWQECRDVETERRETLEDYAIMQARGK